MPHPLQSRSGRRLVDLVNELERRLAGEAPGSGLVPELAAEIPGADTYVLVLADGLGYHQLDHPAAGMLKRANRGVLTAPFPSTTTVSLATVVTGTDPRAHGIIGHLMWLPELGRVVNTLKWISPWGEPISYPVERVMPEPNLWERLSAAGFEPITVQPAGFENSPLSRALYRGCRFEGVETTDEMLDATVTLAREPGRLIFTYLPHVDASAHVFGQTSAEYAAAISAVETLWANLAVRLGPNAVAVGTADHGHIDYDEQSKMPIATDDVAGLTFFGDSRSVYVRGDPDLIQAFATRFGTEPIWAEAILDELGDGPDHPELGDRLPTALIRAERGRLLLPKGFDRRLIGYHGGVEPEEIEIPMLVSRPSTR